MIHADCNSTAHDLRQLLGHPGRHFRRMCIDHLATIIDLDAGPCQCDEVGGPDNRIFICVREHIDVVGIDAVDQTGHGVGQLVAHGDFAAGVPDCTQTAANAAGA